MQTGLSVTYGFYTERENPSEALRGYAVFVIPQGLKYGLLDYLAILPAYRGSGIGQWFFAEISQILLQKNPKLQGFFIETEAVTFAPDEVQRQVREKRNRFYKRCGCLPAKLGSGLLEKNRRDSHGVLVSWIDDNIRTVQPFAMTQIVSA